MNNLATIGFNVLKLLLSLLDYSLLNFERHHQFFVNNQLMLMPLVIFFMGNSYFFSSIYKQLVFRLNLCLKQK